MSPHWRSQTPALSLNPWRPCSMPAPIPDLPTFMALRAKCSLVNRVSALSPLISPRCFAAEYWSPTTQDSTTASWRPKRVVAACTFRSNRRLDLGVSSLKLSALAKHWGIAQIRPHDALDDAQVLAQVLTRQLAIAREKGVTLPVRHPNELSLPVFPSSAAA